MPFPLEIKRTGGSRFSRGGGGGKKPPADPAGDGGTQVAVDGTGQARLERDATRVVRQAASVLEQELAAGIAAVKRIEARFLDVQQVRQRPPEEVMQRFRVDAHDVVDLVFDVLTVAVDKASNLAERGLSAGRSMAKLPRGLQAAQVAASRQMVPTLAPPQPLSPGQTAELSIAVENDGTLPTKPITFSSSDLVSNEGKVIPGANVRCLPNDVVLAPRASERVAVQIHVPQGTAPGTYCGMFSANHLPAVRAVLVVEVRGAA